MCVEFVAMCFKIGGLFVGMIGEFGSAHVAIFWVDGVFSCGFVDGRVSESRIGSCSGLKMYGRYLISVVTIL